ncbi:hypothetical protein [Paenibacillus marinisediminis]
MNVIQLGPLTLQGDLLAVIASVLIAAVAMALRLKLEHKSPRQILDWTLTVMIVLVLNLKFGYLWESPSVIWEQPKALLFLNGTSMSGNVLLAIGLLAWTASYIRKSRISIPEFADTLAHGLLMGIAGFGIFYSLLGFQTPGLTPVPLPATMQASLPAVESILALLLLIGLWIRRRPIGTYSDALITTLSMGSIGMLLSYTAPQESLWLGLSLLQWGYVSLLLTGYLILRSKEQVVTEESISKTIGAEGSAISLEPPENAGNHMG